MKICSYCRTEGNMSKEHIIPDWLYKITPDYFQFIEKSKKYTQNEQKIKDVCATCNNGVLSVLDNYIKNLYDTFFFKFIEKNESTEFKYNFDELCRWILKVSFNSARKNDNNANNFDRKIIDYILSGENRPIGTTIFVQLITPYHTKNDILKPYNNRILYINPSFSKLMKIGRIITLNSYHFYLLIPKEENYDKKEWIKVQKNLKTVLIDPFELLPEQECINIKGSILTIKDTMERFIKRNKQYL